MKTTTAVADWKVLRASVNGRGGLHVEGVNRAADGAPFFWDVNKHGIKGGNFDFTACEFAPGALCRYAHLLESA